MSDPTFQARGCPGRAPGVAHARVSVSCWRTSRSSVPEGCWAAVPRAETSRDPATISSVAGRRLSPTCKSASRPTSPACWTMDRRGQSRVSSRREHPGNQGSKSASRRTRHTPRRLLQGTRESASIPRSRGGPATAQSTPTVPVVKALSALTARSVGRSLALMPARPVVLGSVGAIGPARSVARSVEVDETPRRAYLQIIGPRLRSRSFLRRRRPSAGHLLHGGQSHPKIIPPQPAYF